MNKYSIGNIVFKTKKACEEYTRTKIKKLGCCIIDNGHVDFIFFENLLKNHHDYDKKIGVGIDYFYIIPNPINQNYYQTMIKRLDKSIIDFSWVYCCKFKVRSITEDLTAAMREAIKEETIAYKKNQIILQCNICKSDNELYGDYQVDHDFPPFRDIKNNFLNLTPSIIPQTFSSCNKYYTTIFNDKDKEFKNEWIDYHNKNCSFQILCRSCNLKKH